MGPAQTAYLRMLSGADAIKPDSRIRTKLREIGFPAPPDDGSLILVAEAAAEDLGTTRLHLDQLLWN